jgi:heptose-I-phosphate ethanolaminephosphotransferase
MQKQLTRLLLDTGLATSFFLPGFVIGWGVYPSLLYTTIFVAIVMIFVVVTKNLPKLLTVALALPVIALQIANIGTYKQFGFPFEYGALRTTLDTNPGESLEFALSAGLTFWLLLLAIIALYGLLLWWYVRSPIQINSWKARIASLVALAVFAAPLALWHKSRYDFYSYLHIYRLAFKYTKWQKLVTRASLQRALIFQIRQKAQTTNPDTSNLDETVIVVIGESLRRDHLGLYGYKRQTTPLMNARRDQLMVFTKAISPANSTAFSLPNILSPLTTDGNKEDFFNNLSLVGEARLAGFTTNWISNSHLLGGNINRVGIISREAQNQFSVGVEGRSEKFFARDDEMLPIVDNILASQSGKKKIIFLATRGSHTIYRKRYPARFEKFKPVMTGNDAYAPDQRQKIINAYDNTILFTDWFLDQLIQKLEATGKPATLLFFADHGERLYEDGKTMFHGFKPPRQIELKVPFFIWKSKDRNCQSPHIATITDQPVNMEYFFSIAKYAMCIDKKIPQKIYDNRITAQGVVYQYDQLKKQ